MAINIESEDPNDNSNDNREHGLTNQNQSEVNNNQQIVLEDNTNSEFVGVARRVVNRLYLGGAREGATSELVTEYMERKGDFNLPDFSWSNNTALSNSENYSILMDIIQDNFLTQLVIEPTREHNVLDLVLATSSDSIKSLSVGEKFSDHNMITFLLTGQPYVQLKSKKYVYCYKKADWLQLKLTLSQIPWNLAFLEESIVENWNSWKDLFFAAVDECIPKTKGKKRQNAPWINKELISLCRKKKLLYKKAKRSQNESTWIRYRQMNNNLKRKCNEARWRYITDLAQDLTDNDNPKPFWNFVKSKCKGTNKLISLKVGESVFTDDQVLDYIVDERLENIRCSVDEVGKLLLNLKVEKSPGPDNIPARILKSGKLPTLHRFLKKVRRIVEKTIVRYLLQGLYAK
ncbi:Hypothetical predicted protein [Paramuricea clavata]|uniref:Uncharacterized protein n=1 Tax=Paramuricea clavata TaxID=317549 RepID=A0A7D9JD37_PARCT|nr:Hypothetical predicted protein [Paramuricea clavata]